MTHRETELQEKLTDMENERRMWKARAEATRDLLIAVLVDVPLTGILAKRDVQYDQNIIKRIMKVEERNALLEKDAWSKAAQVAKDFIKDAKRVLVLDLEGVDTAHISMDARLFIGAWRDRFKKALGEDDQEASTSG